MAAESEKTTAPVAAAALSTADDRSDSQTAVEQKPAEEAPPKQPFFHQTGIFFKLLFAVQPTWLDIALIFSGTIFAMAAGTPFPLIAIVFGQLVDDLNGATCAAESNSYGFDYESQINEKIALMAYIAIGAFVLIYAYITIWGVVSQRLAQRMRVAYLKALLRQPPSFFDSRAGAQDISSSLHGDIAAIQAGTSEKVGIFITSMSFFVTSFIIAFIKQPKLAGMLTSMVPAFLIMSIVGGAYFGKYAGKMAESFATASSLAGECLSNIAVVQAFGAATRLEGKFSVLTADASKSGIKKATVAAVQAGFLYFIAYAGNALAFWQGSYFVARTAEGDGDGTSVGSIYTVIMILVDACVMLGNTAPILPLFGGASAAYQRLLRDIEAPSLIDATSERGQVLSGDIKSVDIHFNGVSFAYPSRPTQPVLRNVDLSFPTGRYTAIVGLSGSGKSTVAALLSRLYDPTEGSITIDGHDVKDLNVRSLRSLMGFVQQEPSLMNGSIFSNIARGLINSPGSSHAQLKDFLYSAEMEELSDKGRDIMNAAKGFGPQAEEICRLVQDAAEQADAATFIERLENGYGTSVGPKGSLLSGGQRQRVALAQALIRDPRILVLDEATSALDSASERRIQGAVERAAKHRTVICIAHRLSTIRNADTIIVMEAGQVVEQGSYTELMAREGTTFERMVKLQSLAHKDKGDGGSISGDSVAASTLKADTVDFEKNEKIDEPTKEIEAKKEETQASDSALDAVQPASSVWRTLARFIRPSLPWLLMAMGAAFIVGLTFPSSGTIIGVTVGELNPCSNTPDHIRQNGRLFGGLLFMLAVVELFANFAAWSCFGVVAEKLLYLIRVLCFRSLMEQDIHWHQSESPAKLLAIITKDSAAVGGFSGSTLGTVFSILVNFVAAIVLSHIIAWKIALVCLASVPILLGCGFMQLRMLARYEERTAGAFANAAAVAVEAVQSIRTVAVLSLEKETMSIFSRLLRGPQQQILRASASTNIWLAMTHSTGKLVYCLSYWWGSRFIMRGEYSQTQFFIVLISMLVSAQLWATMFNLAPEFSRAHTAMSRTMNIIRLGSTQDVSKVVMGGSSGAGSSDVEATGETGEPSSPVQAGENRGVGIRFDKVSFAYPNRPDVSVLEEVSLTIQPGQFVGLVGPSGAGKSTIMSLVQRLYNPTSGTISLDDRDISSINTSAFRDNIALVPQDPTLFSGTVRFNVSLGAAPGHEATDEEIKEACRLANIHHVIESLPDGYDTDCGAGASRLSGGQRQRLAIARALVRRPRLLLLDESTSALDAESEAALQEGLERASKGTTVLAITHRLHTVQKANVIFVVEGGRIVDSGRHTDLMERNQSYSVNATQQMLQ